MSTDLVAMTAQFFEHLETFLHWQSQMVHHQIVNPVLQIVEIVCACDADRKWV
jgi:hypothetical protein